MNKVVFKIDPFFRAGGSCLS